MGRCVGAGASTPRQDGNYYDDDGYEDGYECSDDAIEGDDNDRDHPTDLQQPYVAPGGGTLGVGGESNPERGGEATRAGSQGVAIGNDAPPKENDAGSNPTNGGGAANEQRIHVWAGDEWGGAR